MRRSKSCSKECWQRACKPVVREVRIPSRCPRSPRCQQVSGLETMKQLCQMLAFAFACKLKRPSGMPKPGGRVKVSFMGGRFLPDDESDPGCSSCESVSPSVDDRTLCVPSSLSLSEAVSDSVPLSELEPSSSSQLNCPRKISVLQITRPAES